MSFFIYGINNEKSDIREIISNVVSKVLEKEGGTIKKTKDEAKTHINEGGMVNGGGSCDIETRECSNPDLACNFDAMEYCEDPIKYLKDNKITNQIGFF